MKGNGQFYIPAFSHSAEESQLCAGQVAFGSQNDLEVWR